MINERVASPISRNAFVNILYDKWKELLPLPVSRIAFVNILSINERVASLLVSGIAFVNILYDK